MAAGWLYKVDANGLHVTPEFMARLRSGEGSALRSLDKQKLTLLYQTKFTRESRRPDAEGLLWSSMPPLHLIPFVREGRHPPPAWIKDGPLVVDTTGTNRAVKGALAFVRMARQSQQGGARYWRKLKQKDSTVKLPPPVTTSVKVSRNNIVTGWYMKTNPNFELVVINRHDRGTLLKLLSELDTATNVEAWLAARTVRVGVTYSKSLHADYAAWCAADGETPAGIKSFAQALIAAGVQKLTRSKDGERYEVTLK